MAKSTKWRAPPESYASSGKVAHRSGYTVEQILNLGQTGRLLARKFRGKWLMDERSLAAFVANRETRPKRGRPAQRRKSSSREKGES